MGLYIIRYKTTETDENSNYAEKVQKNMFGSNQLSTKHQDP